MQETSHRRTHRWNVMSEQRKSDWQHPNTYYREWEETEHSTTDECDTSLHAHPYRTLPTKALQIIGDPGRDVILEAVHFLVEIGSQRHTLVVKWLKPGTLTQRHGRLIGTAAKRVEC
jgi:hypothetical protein